MANHISNSQDLIDIRDVIARLEELRDERQDIEEAALSTADIWSEIPAEKEAELAESEENMNAASASLAEWDSLYKEEMISLESLLDGLKGYGGDHQWEDSWYPVTLIHHSYFTEAMEEMVKDIGDMPSNTASYLVIDWNSTAENLRADYSSVDFDGEEYWYR